MSPEGDQRTDFLYLYQIGRLTPALASRALGNKRVVHNVKPVSNNQKLRVTAPETQIQDLEGQILRPYDGCVLPPQASAIEELHDWSLNYNAGRNPYCVFLDLIGYADDRWGCDAYIAPPITSPGGRYTGVLGYKELCLIANALKLFENNGYDQVYEWCDALDESEEED